MSIYLSISHFLSIYLYIYVNVTHLNLLVKYAFLSAKFRELEL